VVIKATFETSHTRWSGRRWCPGEREEERVKFEW